MVTNLDSKKKKKDEEFTGVKASVKVKKKKGTRPKNAGRVCKTLPVGRWSDWSTLTFRPPNIFLTERHQSTLSSRATAPAYLDPQRDEVRVWGRSGVGVVWAKVQN